MEHLYTKNIFVRVALTLLAMFCFSWAFAENITAEQALQLAQTFVSGQNNVPGGRHNSPGMTPQLTQEKQVSGLYVFNVANNGGFVIVSNDDRTAPILGFGESGHLDPDNMPSNMRAWLQGYADQIAWLQKQEAQGLLVKQNGQRKAPRRVGTHSTEAIDPLVTCQWNQRDPYNNQCPDYSEGKKAVTGCVATAMAQVMYYHKWPQDATTTIPAYTTGSYQINMPELPATTFDWANMIDVYEDPYTDDQATAVATLMLYCGQSVEMDYGPSSGASSYSVADALRNYFDYNPTTTQCVVRSYYTAAQWADMLYHELKNDRPVVYGGASSGGGHEFVCDGYKYENGQDYFHINWGWGGTSDEYYLLSTLNPYEQGIGGSSTRDGFHYGQDAIIGIQRSTESGTTVDTTPNVLDLTINSMTSPLNPILKGMTVDMTINVTNNSEDDYEGDIYLGLISGKSYYLLDGNNCFIPAGETRDVTVPFTPTETGTFDMIIYLPATGGWFTPNGEVFTQVTVIDAVQNEIVPIYGYWADSYSRSQFIIPAEQMEALTTTDLPISLDGVTFYSSDQSVSWGDAEFDVYLAEVDETTFADTELKDWNSLNKVYSGNLSISNGKMVITFNNPFTYNGGNLLVGINQTTSGTNKECVWLGTTANGASLGGYGTTISQQNFIPATTFDFSAGAASSVKRPTELTVAYTGGLTATVSWMSEETAFDIEVNGIVTEDVTSPYVMTELEPATLYEIRVRAKNSEEYSLWTKAVSFTTQAETDAPFFLETTEVTANTATLCWNSIQDSYNVRYRTADDRKEYFFTPFNTDTDWTGWDIGYIISGTVDPIYDYDSGTNHFLEMGWETTAEDYIISPELPDYPSGSVMEFYDFYYQQPNTFQIGYSTTTKSLDAFTWSDPITAGSYYEKYSQVLPDDTKYVAFKATAEDESYAVFIDNFGIFYDVPAGDWAQRNDVGSPLAIEGLEPDTKYEWQVQGIYNSEPTEWSSLTTFTTNAYLELANDDSSADAEGKNSAIIAANAGMVADVKLTDRVFYKDTKWNTVCLPFDVDLTDPECPFYGAIAKTLTDADLEGTHVTLTFGDDVTMLQAGIPYIIRWETGADLGDVEFHGVTIVSGSAADRTISLAGGQVNFIGYYDAFDIDTPDNDDIYYMTANNQLKHTGNKRTLKSCRAYFQFAESILSATRDFVLDFGDKDDVITGIGEVTDSSLITHHSSLSEWHSLDGRKLDKKPTAKGVYLRNGRKVVMK